MSTTDTEPNRVHRREGNAGQGWQFDSLVVLIALLLLVVALQAPINRVVSVPAVQNWLTVFIAVVTQALPFLVLGVLLSAVIAVLVPPAFFARALPKRPAVAVPVAGVAGAVLPGCECASVPVAGALVRRGVTPSAALAFLLSAPAINPVVLAATAVAFPRSPHIVVARFAASLLVACVMGWLWQRLGRADWLRPPDRPSFEGLRKPAAFWGSVRHDVIHAGGFLVVGATAAATLKAVVPAAWLRTVAGTPVVSILLFLIGGAVLRASLTDLYLRYVRAGLRPLLLGAGITLIVAAVATFWYELRPARTTRQDPRRRAHRDRPGDHHRTPVGWLLLLPLFALIVAVPPALGSYAADRAGTALQPPPGFVALPAGDPLRIGLVDYASRAAYDHGRSLGARRFDITGFVTVGPRGAPYLTRMVLSCCAADAQPVKVGLTGQVPTALRPDMWLDVIGTYTDRQTRDDVNGGPIPFINVSVATPVPAPHDPYDS